MIGFIVDTEFVWGFQARIVGLSKTSPSFYYPPPTTFLGALAEVIAREYNIGEDLGRFVINELSRNLLAIGFRPLNCVPIKYEDLNRLIMIRAVGGTIKSPLPTSLQTSFDSPARGKTILASLDDSSPKLRWFLVFKDEFLTIKNDKLKEKINKIEMKDELFWKIHRLGSKESRVCVVDVDVTKGIKKLSGIVITNYSFPTEAIGNDSEEKIRRWEHEIYVDPFIGQIYEIRKERRKIVKKGIFDKYVLSEGLRVFKIPIMVSTQNPEYVLSLRKGWIAYCVKKEDDKEKEVVIGRERC
jgi:CRISPR-associated protein Cas5a/b/c